MCIYNVCMCVYVVIISWLKNFTRVGILVTIALTVAKLYFVPYPLFTGEGTFTPCQKPGDHFGETDGGQVQVKGLKDGGGSAAATTVPARKPASLHTGVVLLETHCGNGNWLRTYQIRLLRFSWGL